MLTNASSRYQHLGLLVLRLGIGISFIYLHGWGKISSGPDKWEGLGEVMENIGIHFWPVFWGFMASLAEFGGGILLVLGLFTRPAALMMAFTMFVASMMHFADGEINSHSLEMLVVFIAIFLMGAGKYSLDARIKFK